MKKTIAKITAMLLSAASLTALSANAISVVDGRAELEAELDSKYTNACELTDLFGNFSDCSGAWVKSRNDAELSWIALQVITDNLSVSTAVTDGDKDEIAAYLREQLGYADIVNIRVNKWGDTKPFKITITFSGEQSELNRMIAEKAFYLIEEKYGISKDNLSNYSFGRVITTEYTMTMQTAPVDPINIGVTEEKISESNKILTDNGIRVQYNTEPDGKTVMGYPKYAVFPEDMTVQECLEYAIFVQNNFNYEPKVIHFDTFDPVCDYGFTGDNFSAVDKDYNTGDANEDSLLTIADAAAVLQNLGNADKYPLTAQGKFNADFYGGGLTTADAVEIQKTVANID